MKCRIAALLLLLTGCMATTALGESGTPLQEALPPLQEEPPSPFPSLAISTPRPTKEAGSCLDFSEVNLTTPKQTVISFLDQFNGVMPACPVTDLPEICAKVAQPSCKKDCLALFETRLTYLKSLRGKVQGAHFVPKSLAEMSGSPQKLSASWQEKLTFTDGTTKITDMAMLFVVEKTGKEWRVLTFENYR